MVDLVSLYRDYNIKPATQAIGSGDAMITPRDQFAGLRRGRTKVEGKGSYKYSKDPNALKGHGRIGSEGNGTREDES